MKKQIQEMKEYLNSVMKIKQNINFDEIDSFYKLLNKNNSVDLIISRDLNHNKFGIQSELILLFITWFKKSNGKLILNTSSTDVNILEDFVNKHYNFSIIALAFNRGIFNLDGEKINEIILPFIKKKFDEIDNNLYWGKGDHSYVICLQKSLNPYPKAFYNNEKLRSRVDFENLTKYLINTSIKTKTLSNLDSNMVNDNLPVIGKIIYELIENTHNWSLTDYNNEDLIYGVRNLIISNHHGNKNELITSANEDVYLSEYIVSMTDEGYTNFIEISVIDSGSGLCSKYSKKPIENYDSYEEVYAVIENCLTKSNTSDTSSLYNRGYGLHKIMELLSEKNGFLKIRTNGLKLFRNFKSYKFDNVDYSLKNYYENDENYSFKNFLNQGTIVTFFIPLK